MTICTQRYVYVRVVRVHGDLVLRGVTDETLVVGERDIRWGSPVTLVVGDDLDTVILPDTNTPTRIANPKISTKKQVTQKRKKKDVRVGGAEIDTDGF